MPRRISIPFAVLITALTASLGAAFAQVTGVDGVTVEADDPQRIVALNSSVFEIMFELGLDEHIVGTDGSATYPEHDLPSVGHPYNYAVEGLLSLMPDLVISAEENMKPETAAQLRSAGVQVLVLPHSGRNGMEGLYERIDAIATLLGAQEEGDALIARIRGEVEALESALAAIPDEERRDVLFIYSHSLGDSTIYGGEQTGPGTLISLAGGNDAGDVIGGEHVSITSEALVTANPDTIIMLERGLEAVGGVAGYLQLPGVALTEAGKNEAVYTVDNSVRWIGPRFPKFAAELASSIYGLELP